MIGQRVTAIKRASRVVDPATRAAAVDTVIAAMETGLSFTGASAMVALSVGVNESTVRTWVNDSGRRPQSSIADMQKMRIALAETIALNRRLAAQLENRD